jgi:hypothetical protein
MAHCIINKRVKPLSAPPKTFDVSKVNHNRSQVQGSTFRVKDKESI